MPDAEMTQALRVRRKRKRYAVYREGEIALDSLGPLPGEDEAIKAVSFCQVSTIGMLRYVANQTVIRELTVSTFRIGPTALRELKRLRERGRLEKASFIVGKILGRDNRKTSAVEHYQNVERVCRECGWRLAARDNHTKLTLFDTDAGKFVLESSSNLNEAPNWEQFSLEQDAELYEFWRDAIELMFLQAR
jgi:hypothetical protein